MLIGGFYHIDPVLLEKEPETKDLELRCDLKGQYSRKIYTGNGRTAASYVFLNAVHLTEDDVILLPDYLCVSVINSLEVCPAKFRFYRVNRDLTADVEDMKSKIDEKVKVLYVIHYFGVPQPEVVDEMKKVSEEHNLIIVEDLTQTLYSREDGRIGFGDYLVASTRKWMPVTDGGILAVKDGVDCPMVPLKDAYDEAVYKQLLISIMRDYYDAHPDKDISYYLQLEKEANKARYLDFTPKEMTELTSKNLIQLMDHKNSVKKRRENYTYLYEQLKDVEGLTLAGKPLDDEENYVPFGFVVLVENRQEFYQYLANHGIIGEIQWILPEEYYTPGEDAKYLSDHNVMLQCDQRYGREEMAFVVDTIKEYFRRQK